MARYWIALGAVAALLVGGCVQRVAQQSGTTGPAGGGGGVELILFTWTEVTEVQANQQLLAEFEQAHPGVKVRLQNIPGSGEAMQKLQTMMAAGEAPDVMSIHGAYHLSFAARGVLAPLDQLAGQDAEFNLADFYPGLLDICRYQEKLYSLPRYTSVYALFYNKARFDAAGVPYPGSRGQWTWDDYLQAAQRLTRDTNGDGRPDEWGTYIDFWGSRIYPWLWQNGADLMNADRSRCVVDSPEAVEALTFLSDLRLKRKVAPPTTSGERNEGLDLFAQGKLGMYITGPWDVQTLKGQAGLQWDVAPLPVRKQAATLLGTENYAISATSKHPQEAWELFKFLLSARSQQYMAEQLEKMPSRRSVAEGPYMQQATYNRRAFVEALSYAQAAPNIPEWDQISHYVQDQLDLIWAGQKSPAEGLRQAASDVNRALAELRKRGG